MTRVSATKIAARLASHARQGDLPEYVYRRVRRRSLETSPAAGGGGDSARRINRLFDELPGAGRYLEIGLEWGRTFENVKAPTRWGVDPRPRFNLRRLPAGVQVFATTSDEFFRQLDDSETFDVVFIDGLHTFRQTYRDLVNAFRVCPRGAILIDDVIPADEVSAIPDFEESLRERRRLGLPGAMWQGDVFRVVLCIASHHPELSYCTIVGSDENMQTLVWRTDPNATVSSVSDSVIESVEAQSYRDAFASGIPNRFRPRSEDQALEEWRSRRR